MEESGKLNHPVQSGPCIYCKTGDGAFKSEEHIVPESLVGDEIVLPMGMVCDACNSGVLSDLDNYLQNSPLLSLHRVLYGPALTKQRKGPTANYQNAFLSRPGDSHIQLHPKDRTGRIRDFEELPDGTSRFSISLGRHFDHVKFGRALQKIGLGFLALKKGRGTALDGRFDAARHFILRGGAFPNSWMLALSGPPAPGGSLTFWDGGPIALFVLEVSGVRMGFPLEPKPRLENLPVARQLTNVAWFPMDGEHGDFSVSSPPVRDKYPDTPSN
jgi:hypothetical protein